MQFFTFSPRFPQRYGGPPGVMATTGKYFLHRSVQICSWQTLSTESPQHCLQTLVLILSVESDPEIKMCRILSVLLSCLQCMPGIRTPLSSVCLLYSPRSPAHLHLGEVRGWGHGKPGEVQHMQFARRRLTINRHSNTVLCVKIGGDYFSFIVYSIL